MNFARKIYYNDKLLVLTTDTEGYINENPEAENFITFHGAVLKNFTQAIQQLDKPGLKGVIIEDASEQSLLDQLDAMYQPISAGGGVVFNEAGQVLMIFRRGKWDLPKGKLDDGELIQDCALREVSEETGLQELTLGEKIKDTYHIYAQYSQQLLKQTTWYKMTGSGTELLRPQKEENILEARWVSEQDLGPLVPKTYEAIRDVLQTAGLKW